MPAVTTSTARSLRENVLATAGTPSRPASEGCAYARAKRKLP
jgi:hypothetical protein